jgi:hypothetical protein
MGNCFLSAVFFENYKSSSHFWLLFSQGKTYVLIVTNEGLDDILGDFFTNSFGHPDCARRQKYE